MFPYAILVVPFILAVLYCRIFTRFRSTGVKYLKPIPLFGNLKASMTGTHHPFFSISHLYNKFPGERFVGQYEFLRPVLYLKDLNLIKSVSIDNFEFFTDRQPILKDFIDPVIGRMLFSLKGEDWMDMRMCLAPALSGSRIKETFPYLVETATQVAAWLRQRIQDLQTKDNYVDIEVKDMCRRYLNDVMACLVFDQKVDSLAEPNNAFYRYSLRISKFSLVQVLKYFGFVYYPKCMKKLGMTFVPYKARRYFRDLLLTNMHRRQTSNTMRPDIINVLMEMKKNQVTQDKLAGGEIDACFVKVDGIGCQKNVIRAWSDEDLTAQAFLFLLTGLDSTTNCLKFLLYELAINPDVQAKLVQEIREHVPDGKLDYNVVESMSYLQMVVSESLRLWPPVIHFDRLCVKDFDLGKPNINAPNYVVKAGETVLIPVSAIHRDPNYFPNPHKFDPERFSEKNKQKIRPYSYIPFGIGPRNCIGFRLALCLVKILVILLLQQFEVGPCKKTMVPARLATNKTGLELKGGHWIRFKLRS